MAAQIGQRKLLFGSGTFGWTGHATFNRTHPLPRRRSPGPVSWLGPISRHFGHSVVEFGSRALGAKRHGTGLLLAAASDLGVLARCLATTFGWSNGLALMHHNCVSLQVQSWSESSLFRRRESCRGGHHGLSTLIG